MKRFFQNQLLSIKDNFNCYQDSCFSVSHDKSSINVSLDDYHFYFHVDTGYIYFAIYKYDNKKDELRDCFFKQFFPSFSSMMLSLQGFQFFQS